jgi:hypothetical protein
MTSNGGVRPPQGNHRIIGNENAIKRSLMLKG